MIGARKTKKATAGRQVGVLAAAVLVATALAPLASSAARAAGVPTCQGEPATIVGTPRGETLIGTPGPDVILARGGDDVVRARGGDDLVCGGGGADVLGGGGGADRLYGQSEAHRDDRGDTRWEPDLLDGGAGDDLLDVGGDHGLEPISGAHGILDYRAAGASVTVDLAAGTATGQGEDTIVSPPPDSECDCYGIAVYGSAHDDVLLGGEADDYLAGFAGDDQIDGRGGDDLLFGEVYEARASLLPSVRTPRPGPADADTLVGGAGDDRLRAHTGRDVLRGDDGADDLEYLDFRGVAELYGGSGNDSMSAMVSRRPGSVFDGGVGRNDGALLGPVRAVGAGGRPAAAQVRMAAGVMLASGVQWGAVRDIDDLYLGRNIRWDYRGTDGPDKLYSGGLWLHAKMLGGDDVVSGTSGPDRLDAGDGTDRVYGNGGRDRCIDAETVRGCESVSPRARR